MSLLSRIIEDKLLEISRRKKEGLPKEGTSKRATLAFVNALSHKEMGASLHFICEVKRASPSHGKFDLALKPAALAKGFEETGASALSVVTDKPYFGGSLELLKDVREAVSLPLLLKDFVVDQFQIDEARILGADCILLIVRVLAKKQLEQFIEHSLSIGLDVLVEVHDEEELKMALPFENAIIGINNRDLDTLEVDLQTTFRLLKHIPRERIVVSESGISKREEVLKLKEAGVTAALVGTSLLKRHDPLHALRELKGG